MKTSLLSLVFLGLFQVLSAQIDATKLDEFFNTLESNDKFMGSVALMKDGKIVYTRQTGYLDPENKIKPNNNTTYRVGSISKTFTAVLILKAIEEGKLRLGQTIEVFFPKIENASKITIEHLLRHRSGIHSFTSDPEYWKFFKSPISREVLVDKISKYPIDFQPDTKHEYSNSNFSLLSYILEDIYQDTFSNILQNGIVKPLELQHTYLSEKIDTSANQAKSYKYEGTFEAAPETHYSVCLGAGGIASSPTDLLKFEKALFNYKIISKKSVEMMVDIKDRYGLGTMSYPYGKLTSYGHGGRIDGFRSTMGFFRESNNGIAITANGINYKINNIALACLAAIYEHPIKIPAFSKTISVSEKDLSKLRGVYSSPTFPLKITVFTEDGRLKAQATGQGGFTLDALSKTSFQFIPAGLILEFNPSKKEMTLKQGGQEFLLTMEI